MPVYISIGVTCGVKYQLDKHTGQKGTLFFDRLKTEMDSVNSMFENYNNLDTMLHKSQIIKDPICPIFMSRHSKILINSLSRCVAVHDLNVVYNETDVDKFIEKYKNRFNRIIDYINGTDEIIFLRYTNIDADQQNRFIKAIKLINPKCNFWIVCVNPGQDSDELIKGNNFLKFNIKKSKQPVEESWELFHLHWSKIFSDIRQNIK